MQGGVGIQTKGAMSSLFSGVCLITPEIYMSKLLPRGMSVFAQDKGHRHLG